MPLMSLTFAKGYPKLHALIQESWRVKTSARPSFDSIASHLQSEIGDEIGRKDEPEITVYRNEPDQI